MNDPNDITVETVTALTEMNRKLHWAITRGLDEFQTEGNDLGERQGQVRLLHMLARDRSLAMSDIAQRMRVSRPTVTGIVRGLMEQGLIERTNDPDDWRVVHAAITDAGDAVLAGHRARLFARVQTWIDELDEPERTLLLQAAPAMRALSNVLDERQQAAGAETGGHRARQS